MAVRVNGWEDRWQDGRVAMRVDGGVGDTMGGSWIVVWVDERVARVDG